MVPIRLRQCVVERLQLSWSHRTCTLQIIARSPLILVPSRHSTSMPHDLLIHLACALASPRHLCGALHLPGPARPARAYNCVEFMPSYLTPLTGRCKQAPARAPPPPLV
mmetsp:Transcript_11311/g.37448  ORF Transcript_11311/g.37448 Transcript_11311/m.37448 type:complete len:109 (+) Transcript_11311:411-737(+)